MSKKGIMFTIMSVLVCALIITSFFTYKSIALDSNVDNTRLRIKNINRYVDESDVYIRSVASIAGSKTLDFTLNIMIGNNSYLTNYTKEFESCLLTGRMNVSWNPTSPIYCPSDVVVGNRFHEFEEFSRTKLNINSNMHLNSISLDQGDPWNLRVAVNYTLTINDSYAFWNETRVVYGNIYIIGYRDPTYYIVNDQTDLYKVRYPMVVNSSFLQAWNETPSNAQVEVLNKHYFEWNGAPSYLDRLSNVNNESMFSRSCGIGVGRCGIVSIVSPDFIEESMLATGSTNTRSSMDFEFWKNKTIDPYYYRRLNFDLLTSAQRASMHINYGDSNHMGMNGTVVRTTVLGIMNMTNYLYLSPVN
jgi:hypothetical protein